MGTGLGAVFSGGGHQVCGRRRADSLCLLCTPPPPEQTAGRNQRPPGGGPHHHSVNRKTDRPQCGLRPQSTPTQCSFFSGLGLPNCTTGQPSTPATALLSTAPSPVNTGQMRPRGTTLCTDCRGLCLPRPKFPWPHPQGQARSVRTQC